MIIILLHLIICDSALELLPANVVSKLNNRGTSKKNPKTINEIGESFPKTTDELQALQNTENTYKLYN